MNDASLALWLTLDNASWDNTTTPALTALAVRQLSHPDVRPGFEFANRSLIQLASKCSAFPWHGRALPADAPWPPHLDPGHPTAGQGRGSLGPAMGRPP